jgi:hypothetical protein
MGGSRAVEAEDGAELTSTAADAAAAGKKAGDLFRKESYGGQRLQQNSCQAFESLSAEKQINVQMLQRTLRFLLRHTAESETETGKTGSPAADLSLTSLKQRFEAESHCDSFQPVRFGPATKEAFQRCLQWLECHAIPDAIRRLKESHLEVPGGLPERARAQDNGGNMSGQPGNKAGSSSRYELGLSPLNPPTAEQMQTLGLTVDWLRRAISSVDFWAIRNEIEATIKQNHLPEGWRYKRGLDERSWVQSARELIDLTQMAGQRIVAMDRMTKSGATFAVELPPATVIVRGAAGDITHLGLDLPSDLSGDQNGRQKIEAIKRWLSKNAATIDQAAADQTVLHLWGDYPKGNGKLLLDRQGDVQATDSDKAPGAGVVADYNLVECRLDVQESNGMIVVKSTTQYQKVPWYGYLNSRAQNIGNPIVATNVYKPDAYVRVPSGSGDCLIQARDLAAWKDSQQRWHYGGKALMAVMDGAMTVSGGIGLYTALKAGVRVVGWQVAARHTFHLGLGASGVINNAGANEVDGLRYANYGRSACFIGSAGWHLFGGALKSSLSAAAMSESVAPQVGAVQGMTRLQSGLAVADGVADGLASVGNLAFQPILLRDLYHAGNEALFGIRSVGVARKR